MAVAGDRRRARGGLADGVQGGCGTAPRSRKGWVGLASPITVNAAFKHIKPAALSRQILALTGQAETLALAKKPAAVKRVVNHTLNA
ncbi:MAG TPA: hypothetical protein VI094_23230 [Propionibacteriaceae bacterium]